MLNNGFSEDFIYHEADFQNTLKLFFFFFTSKNIFL